MHRLQAKQAEHSATNPEPSALLPLQVTVLASIVAAEAKVTYLTQLLEREAGVSSRGSGDGRGPPGGSTPEQPPQSHGQS